MSEAQDPNATQPGTPANPVATTTAAVVPQLTLDQVETEVREQKMLGVTLKIRVPKTIEAFDALAGKADACRNEAIDNIIFRGVLGKARAAFCATVEQASGIKRKTKVKGKTKDAAGNEVDKVVFDETEGDYIERVLAELAVARGVTEVPETELQQYADPLRFGGTAEVKFDPRAKEPGESAKPPKRYMVAAQTQIIDQGLTEKWIAQHGGDGSVEAIARKIQELTLAEERAKSVNRFIGG